MTDQSYIRPDVFGDIEGDIRTYMDERASRQKQKSWILQPPKHRPARETRLRRGG